MTIDLVFSDDADSRLRAKVMDWLDTVTQGRTLPVSYEALSHDFVFDGGPFRLMNRAQGIWKPAPLRSALSIATTYTRPGRQPPYDDRTGADGRVRYKWQGEQRDTWTNRALRQAKVRHLPLVWFFGIGASMYQAVYPVYLVDEEPAERQFVMAVDGAHELVQPGSAVEASLRRYIMRETRHRLHQPVFRATVLRAYETRCAVCSLGHSQLLDGAHIVPDSDERGIASVRNGMALCKIHHAAYDAHILGVRPDHVVEIRSDLLEEIDGPMLRYGLQERHGQTLMALPRAKAERPDQALLQISYEAFRAAG